MTLKMNTTRDFNSSISLMVTIDTLVVSNSDFETVYFRISFLLCCCTSRKPCTDALWPLPFGQRWPLR